MYKIKSSILIMISSFILMSSAASAIVPNPQPSPTYGDISATTIQYQDSVEGWVNTAKPKIIVSVYATGDERNADTVYQQILANLQKIVPQADWRITLYQRSQDKSGLEQFNVQAEARVMNNQLIQANALAKAVSKPGQTYTVLSIDYAPALTDVQRTLIQLRQQIYQDVNQEIIRLKQIYPNTAINIQSINFNVSEGYIPGEPRPVMFNSVTGVSPERAATKAFNVSNKVALSASVTLASVLPLAPK